MVCRPDEHLRSSVKPGTLAGAPAAKADWRAMLLPVAPSGVAQPISTSSTSARSRPARAAAARITWPPSSAPWTLFSAPRKALPIGVRAVETMTAADMQIPLRRRRARRTRSGQKPSGAQRRRPARPRRSAQCRSPPNSVRQPTSRRVRRCSALSWVKPMAPWTWWATAAPTAGRPVGAQLGRGDLEAGVAAVRRAGGGLAGAVHRRGLLGEDGQALLHRLELGDRLAELAAVVGVLDRQLQRRVQGAGDLGRAQQGAEREQRPASLSSNLAPRRLRRSGVSRGSPAGFWRGLIDRAALRSMRSSAPSAHGDHGIARAGPRARPASRP